MQRKTQTATQGSLALAKQPIYLYDTPAQELACQYHDLGLNPFPLPYGEKMGYPWKQLQYTRLDRNHPLFGIRALTSERCNIAIMTGRTSGNLFVIDCESSDEFAYQVSMVQSRGIPLWTVKTSRGGHIYLRCKEGEITSVGTDRMGALEVRGKGGYVLAPPSVYGKTGVIYDWHIRECESPPVISASDIDWLVDKHGLPVELVAVQAKQFKTISFRNPLLKSTQDYLASGSSIADGERHNRLRSAACDYAACGYSKPDAYADLEPIARISGLPDSNDPNEIERLIEWAYSVPRRSYKKGATVPQWQYAEMFADHYNWTGKRSSSRKNIFYALIARARTASNANGTFRASVRELATIARAGVNTVRLAVDMLKDTHIAGFPFVCYAGLDEGSGAALYRFSDNVLKIGRHHMKGISESDKTDTLDFSTTALRYSVSVLSLSDASERGALGHTGMHIYRVLLAYSEPIKTSQLATAANLTTRQIRYSLKKLLQFGLAEQAGRGKWIGIAASNEQLDNRVARPTKRLGNSKKREAKFDRERALRAGDILREAIAKKTGKIETRKERRIKAIK